MEDNSLKILIELFDVALESDNPAVKKALKNLLLVATLVHSEDEKPLRGPMYALVNEVETLKKNFTILSMEFKQAEHDRKIGKIPVASGNGSGQAYQYPHLQQSSYLKELTSWGLK